MDARKWTSRTNNGRSSEVNLGPVVVRMVAVGRGKRRARCSTPCSGSSGPAPRGTTCLTTIRRTRPAIAGFSSGNVVGCCSKVLTCSAEDLRDRGKLDLSETFIDASFSSAKKGAPPWALLDAVRAAKSWRSATAMVLPVAIHQASASPYETTLVEATLARMFHLRRSRHA